VGRPVVWYRYYRPAQANPAEAIRILRAVDMPLDEIAAILGAEDSEMATKRLEMHRERLEEKLADQQRMLRFLARLIDRKEGIMPYEVTVKEVEDQVVASLRLHTDLRTVSETIGQGFGTLMRAMAEARATSDGVPFIIYHEVIDEQTEGEIEICIPVAPGAAPEVAGGEVQWKTVQGGPVTSTLHHGPYSEIAPAYHTLTGWIQDHGHEMAGPPREIYLNDPSNVAPVDLLTEVQWPIDASSD
jgi:effector-binding domain-containing protein